MILRKQISYNDWNGLWANLQPPAEPLTNPSLSMKGKSLQLPPPNFPNPNAIIITIREKNNPDSF